jgi:predicted Zn finger-like uncharacterized protein
VDVRCEKCQTEYELDEARLKPGGVTVKCTNCGHMFKIRKRSITNVGAPPPDPPRNRPSSAPPASPPMRPQTPARAAPTVPHHDEAPTTKRADSVIGEPLPRGEPGDDRHWLIRLENGEQKSCRELSALQQWIVGGIVTRESLISRSGKTWKRLGDIAELSQYFSIADEALRARQERSTKPVAKPAAAGTMLGVGVSAAGGTILPDDDDEVDRRTTGSFKAKPDPGAPRRPPTQPPPPPAKKPPTNAPSLGGSPQIPAGGRATAAWASSEIAPTESMASMPAGPMAGKIRHVDDEPAFAGRVRVGPSDETGFETGRVRSVDDDDDVVPQQKGGKGGFLLVLMALLVMGAAAGAIYVFVIRKDSATVATGSADAGSAVVADAAVVAVADAATPPPVVDAALVQTAIELAHEKLQSDKEIDLRDALKSLEGSAEPGADAMRAHLIEGIAQGMLDRAVLVEKSEAEKLKKDAKALVLEAATPAQKALKATPDDPAANLAMAAVLRLQGKSARDVARYLEPAVAKLTPAWKRDVAIGQALALEREKKYDDAKALLAPLDASADDKLEASGDVRVRFRLAMIAFAQNKPAEAKPLVDSILAAHPDHAGAKALAAKIDNTVVKTDPLPPEDGSGSTKPPDGGNTKPPDGNNVNVNTGGNYDQLLARANALAETNCTKAIELFGKALEQKPNGVEALTGMGYCHIDAKQFASAFSKFRAALAVSSKYEPALWGIAEAYMQQGRKEQALDAVKAYLDVYPGAAKGQKALDRLGGSTPTPTPPENPGSAAPPQNPTPTPTPTPEAPAAGSGTGN